ncbi:nuclear receptor co-repressor 1 [Nowakowskiella sp. JEL0407]|nr:nuclear receptor co-repressor 1 [Nowakowskiella sp. JEL0407]
MNSNNYPNTNKDRERPDRISTNPDDLNRKLNSPPSTAPSTFANSYNYPNTPLNNSYRNYNKLSPPDQFSGSHRRTLSDLEQNEDKFFNSREMEESSFRSPQWETRRNRSPTSNAPPYYGYRENFARPPRSSYNNNWYRREYNREYPREDIFRNDPGNYRSPNKFSRSPEYKNQWPINSPPSSLQRSASPPRLWDRNGNKKEFLENSDKSKSKGLDMPINNTPQQDNLNKLSPETANAATVPDDEDEDDIGARIDAIDVEIAKYEEMLEKVRRKNTENLESEQNAVIDMDISIDENSIADEEMEAEKPARPLAKSFFQIRSASSSKGTYTFGLPSFTQPSPSSEETDAEEPANKVEIDLRRSTIGYDANLAETIYHQNWEITKESSVVNKNNTTPTAKVYRSVQDYDFYEKNITSHELLRPAIAEAVQNHLQSVLEKKLTLQNQYKEQLDEWTKNTEQLENQRARKRGPRSSFGPSSSNNYSGTDALMPLVDLNSTRGRRQGLFRDVARTEAEYEEILLSLQASHEDDSTARQAKEPSQIIDDIELQQYKSYVNNNNLIHDPESELLAFHNRIDMCWTESEKLIFQTRMAQVGKNFHKIAAYLPGKTTSDCVQYYYREKVNLDFKSLLKGNGQSGAVLKKRPRRTGGEIMGSRMLAVEDDKKRKKTTVTNLEEEEEEPNAADEARKARAEQRAQRSNGEYAKSMTNSPNGVGSPAQEEPIQIFQAPTREKCGPWSEEEKKRLRNGIAAHGRQFNLVAAVVATRSEFQCRRYALTNKKAFPLPPLGPDEKDDEEILLASIANKRRKKLKPVTTQNEEEDEKDGNRNDDKKKKKPVSTATEKKKKRESLILGDDEVSDTKPSGLGDTSMDVDTKSVPGMIQKPAETVTSPRMQKEIPEQFSANNFMPPTTPNGTAISIPGPGQQRRTVSYWSVAEKDVFLSSLERHGRNWDLISREIGTKSAIQARNYYHSFRTKLNLDRRLEEHGHSVEEEKLPIFIGAPVSTNSDANAQTNPPAQTTDPMASNAHGNIGSVKGKEELEENDPNRKSSYSALARPMYNSSYPAHVREFPSMPVSDGSNHMISQYHHQYQPMQPLSPNSRHLLQRPPQVQQMHTSTRPTHMTDTGYLPRASSHVSNGGMLMSDDMRSQQLQTQPQQHQHSMQIQEHRRMEDPSYGGQYYYGRNYVPTSQRPQPPNQYGMYAYPDMYPRTSTQHQAYPPRYDNISPTVSRPQQLSQTPHEYQQPVDSSYYNSIHRNSSFPSYYRQPPTPPPPYDPYSSRKSNLYGMSSSQQHQSSVNTSIAESSPTKEKSQTLVLPPPIGAPTTSSQDQSQQPHQQLTLPSWKMLIGVPDGPTKKSQSPTISVGRSSQSLMNGMGDGSDANSLRSQDLGQYSGGVENSGSLGMSGMMMDGGFEGYERSVSMGQVDQREDGSMQVPEPRQTEQPMFTQEGNVANTNNGEVQNVGVNPSRSEETGQSNIGNGVYSSENAGVSMASNGVEGQEERTDGDLNETYAQTAKEEVSVMEG